MRHEIIAEGIEVYHADFRECMELFGKVDHLITDPPYEQISHDATGKIRRNDGSAAPEALTFDGIDNLRADVVKLAKENCSGWGIFFCTTEGVALWRDEIERQGVKYKTPCIWVKPDAMPKFNGQGPSHGHECMVTSWCGSGYSVWNGGGRRGVFTHMVNPSDRDGEHKTEKPVSLMMELVSLFTQPGEIVGDPFMGSGTTGIACIRLGRRFVGCEIDEKYFDLSCRRLEKATKQTDMFVNVPKLKQGKLTF